MKRQKIYVLKERLGSFGTFKHFKKFENIRVEEIEQANTFVYNQN